MKLAVEGCMHGDLDKVYETIEYIENTRNIKFDLLLCCGDFQAVRNEKDMESLSVPPKYREMKSFWKYYSVRRLPRFPPYLLVEIMKLPIIYGNCTMGDGQHLIYTSWDLLGLSSLAKSESVDFLEFTMHAIII